MEKYTFEYITDGHAYSGPEVKEYKISVGTSVPGELVAMNIVVCKFIDMLVLSGLSQEEALGITQEYVESKLAGQIMEKE